MPTLDLGSQPWFLAQTSRIDVDAQLDDPARLDDWIPATVPGSIQRDLMQAGRLPDLYQELDLDAVLRQVDEQDWWYRTTVPGIESEQRAWLRFAGIDYQAAVMFDGRELGRGPGYVRKAGMGSHRTTAAGASGTGSAYLGWGSVAALAGLRQPAISTMADDQSAGWQWRHSTTAC